MAGGDGWAAVTVHLMLLNCVIMVHMVNFMHI
jgi:hypothetical protein